MGYQHFNRSAFDKAIYCLTTTQKEVAVLAGISESRLSQMLNGTATATERVLRAICRRGLMVKAALLGWEDAEIMKYSEHVIFGRPWVDPAVVLPEVRELAEAERARRREMRGAA